MYSNGMVDAILREGAPLHWGTQLRQINATIILRNKTHSIIVACICLSFAPSPRGYREVGKWTLVR